MAKVKSESDKVKERMAAALQAEVIASSLNELGNKVTQLGNPVEGENISLLACKLRNMPELARWDGMRLGVTMASEARWTPASTAPPLTTPLSAAEGQRERTQG